ncbi:MAG: hypothetical protein IT287_01585 [Bdellovibrionaceae bacterium]|nr:hypothetical protein [Pseudobdellovibrionaceae bacterium]
MSIKIKLLKRVGFEIIFHLLIVSVSFADCATPWNEQENIGEGDFVWAYLSPVGDHLASCRKQKRICKNGALLGSFSFKNCNFKFGCTTEFGFIPESSEITAYRAPAGDKEGACVAQKRVCTKGVLSGTYTYLACQPLKTLDKNSPSVVFD